MEDRPNNQLLAEERQKVYSAVVPNSIVDRIETCKDRLQKYISEGPTITSSAEFIETCRKWLNLISKPAENLPVSVIEKCEAVLVKKIYNTDEIDYKILEIKCELKIKYKLLVKV